MNTAFFIIGGLVISYLVLTGKAWNMRPNQWLALALSLLALNFARGGNFWMMGVCASIATYLYISGNSKKSAKNQTMPDDLAIEQARALLGVAANADPQAINKAWRQTLSNHHPDLGPDRGGDADLAQQINRARDVLLEKAKAEKSETSDI